MFGAQQGAGGLVRRSCVPGRAPLGIASPSTLTRCRPMAWGSRCSRLVRYGPLVDPVSAELEAGSGDLPSRRPQLDPSPAR
ncbi:hypothetical protein EBM89_14585 [Cellulomonas triticagri]|uniref:Uncharacterized protein n=1 Tax=Cellulomonas triticagri TaxID=2483352 RepID=A0A3M2J0I6_9CELL|nr:hypothetical protein EBM89_14585 [Cellulomonas triticagri]